LYEYIKLKILNFKNFKHEKNATEMLVKNVTINVQKENAKKMLKKYSVKK